MRRDLDQRAAQRARRAQPPGQGAGIDASDARHPVDAQVGVQVVGVLAAGRIELADDERLDPRPTGLGGAIEDAVAADEGVGHDDDLAVVRGVGRDLLIAGHRGVEDDLARRARCVAECLSPPDRSVFQAEHRRPAHRCITIHI